LHHWYAHSLEAQGRLAEAMKEMRASLAPDLLSLPIHWDIGNQLLAAEKFDEARQFLDKANELFPNYPIIACLRAQAYYHKGDVASGERVIDALKTSHPELKNVPAMMAFFGAAAARSGHRAEAQRILGQLERMHETRYVEPVLLLELCSVLGDRKQLTVGSNEPMRSIRCSCTSR
jgi:predicted Zn-dependent protease